MPHRHAGPPFDISQRAVADMHSGTAWFDGFRAFVASRRLSRPREEATAPPTQQAAERAIISASLASTLAEGEAVRVARRMKAAGDPPPATVITTSHAGIIAAEELLASTPELAAIVGPRVIAVSEIEYRLWCISVPDDTFLHHVNVWNWIKTSVPMQRHAEFACFPINAGEVYWLHREGRSGAAGLDRRACHLWRWNGRHASLLKAFVTERGVGPLRPTSGRG